MRSALIEAGCDGTLHLVIDLFAITSMDSASPYMLLEARLKHRLSGGGHHTVITHPSSHAIPELPSVAIRAAFDVQATLTDAFHARTYAGTRSSHRSPEATTRQTSLADSASAALNSRSVQQALARWQRSDAPNAAVAAPTNRLRYSSSLCG